MMRFLLILLILLSSIGFAQNTYTLHCKDAETGENIQNIEIHDVDKKLGFTDSKGKVNISTRHNMIFCSHISYADTVIHLSQSQKIIINLNKEKTQLSEGIVKSKYNQCKHLERLLEKNIKRCQSYDTVLHYAFNYQYKIHGTDYYAEFSSIVRLHFTGYEDLYKPTEDLEQIIRYNPLKDYSCRTIYMSKDSSNLPQKYWFDQLGYTSEYCTIGGNLDRPSIYRKGCSDCKRKFPYKNQDSLIFHFSKTQPYNLEAVILFSNENLLSIEFQNKDKEFSPTQKDIVFYFIMTLDSVTRLVQHQEGQEEYRYILPSGEDCFVTQKFTFDLMDSLPVVRNTDIALTIIDTPKATYNLWQQMHKKYYIPEMQLPKTPNIIKQLYEKDEERYYIAQ